MSRTSSRFWRAFFRELDGWDGILFLTVALIMWGLIMSIRWGTLP